jgi:hypothetical protein
MPKVVLAAHELTDAQVDFVSLVGRGANQIPFRIVKEEHEFMLDLAKIGRSLFKRPDTAPAVVAACVRKGADLDAVRARLVAAGLTVDQVQDVDDAVMFVQPGVEATEAAIVKLDRDVGLVVRGLAKAFQGYDFRSTSFADSVTAESFFPSLSIAAEILCHTIGNVLAEESQPGNAADRVAATIDEFRSYVTTLVRALPVTAFKAEAATLQKFTIDIRSRVPDSDVESSPTVGNETETGLGVRPASNDVEGTPVAGSGTPENPGNPPDAGVRPASSDVEDTPVIVVKDEAAPAPETLPVDALTGLRKDLLDEVQAMLKTAMADLGRGLERGLEDLGSRMQVRLDEAEARLSKAERALGGTVPAVSDEDHAVRKQAGNGRVPPLLDTAFMPRPDVRTSKMERTVKL